MSVIGTPLRRVDGRDKVTGNARYAADHDLHGPAYWAWIVEATIGRGRVRSIELDAALACEGVVRILTHRDAPPQRPYGEPSDAGRFEMSHALLYDDEVRYYGQPVAVVVAETLEAARDAAARVQVTYTTDEGRFVVPDPVPEELLHEPDELDGGLDADVVRGDVEAALAAAHAVIDQVYTTPEQAGAAMEPHATLATFDGETLDVHVAIQIVDSAVTALANTFALAPEQVRVRAPFVGGGFGSKLGIHSDAVLASMAAIALEHPVKLVQTRRNVFHNGPHRGSSRQRIRLAATRDGTLTLVQQDSVMPEARDYPFAEPVASTARAAWAATAHHSVHRTVQVDRSPIDSMRAPGEAIGTLTLEAALDELAEALELDPVELRRRNLASREPSSGKAFAHFDLGRCLDEGARRFGWDQRPASGTTDGRWRVGWGMASCTRVNMREACSASVRMDVDGTATVQLDMTDIGTGTYTVLTQIAADALGLPTDRVRVELADSSLPTSCGSGGSFGSASAGAAVHQAATELAHLLEDGAPTAQTEAHYEPDDSDLAEHAYGAHFVEVGVDEATGEVRLRRIVSAFSFGRILNARTAHSQLLGGIVYGIGGALTEHLEMDGRFGSFVNRDFAEYHLPVQRDIPPIEILMLEEPVDACGPLGSKGIGELGLSGIGGAIANAVHHAVGVRVRDFPITPDKVLLAMIRRDEA